MSDALVRDPATPRSRGRRGGRGDVLDPDSLVEACAAATGFQRHGAARAVLPDEGTFHGERGGQRDVTRAAGGGCAASSFTASTIDVSAARGARFDESVWAATRRDRLRSPPPPPHPRTKNAPTAPPHPPPGPLPHPIRSALHPPPTPPPPPWKESPPSPPPPPGSRSRPPSFSCWTRAGSR